MLCYSFLDPKRDKSTVIPPDVITLAERSGMRGVMHWPTYSHRETVDHIDKMSAKYKNQFPEVRIYLH